MSIKTDQDYGPLTHIIGKWRGEKGRDIAPEPDGTEENDYYELIQFSGVGEVTNAEEQPLMAVHYRQQVNRASDDKLIHDQTGYWLWNSQNGEITHSFTLPRGMAVLAVGTSKALEQGGATFEVKAGAGSGSITQLPFLQEKASTESFHQSLTLTPDALEYSQTTMLTIYGRSFEHTDANSLSRVF